MYVLSYSYIEWWVSGCVFINVRKDLLFFLFYEEENVIVEYMYLFEMVLRGLGF